jgi:tRNA (cmo5U34)-methyltransferase
MKRPITSKSSVDEIRERFDRDVARFCNLETGQSATIDAPLAMELITRAAVAATPEIRRCLDIGCGAGNNTIRLLAEAGQDIDCDLCDLSAPMLNAAYERVSAASCGKIRVFHGDFRDIDLETESYDVILAAAVLHHLRDDHDWEQTFRKIHSLIRPGGSFWITDLITHEIGAVDEMMWRRYADYLIQQGGQAYQEKVLDYINQEDSPRPLTYQLDLLRKVGFRSVDILHKNSNFAAFGACK